EQGLEQGAKEKSLEIARKLLDILDEATISQTTGLSLEEIQRLKEEK
ncbi:MAG TPA: transposase, partial [Cyanobacteria bacterium UBA11166]|nr:transposase [Cyanobacteria bacterium UBA11166]